MDSFKDRVLDALKRWFSSAKTYTMLTGLIVYLAAKRGFVLSPDDVQGILIFFGGLLGAQGLNDIGKGKAQVEATTPPPPETVVNQTIISSEK